MRRPHLPPALATAAALFPMTFVILVVNFWIYYARYLYIQRYPAETSVHPPTISRAISDPVIGNPFALWVSASAILLFIAWLILARLNWRFAQSLPSGCGGVRAAVVWGTWGMVLFQFLTSVGMITLSCFPLAKARDAHMFGSYLFFGAQSFSILIATLVAFRIKGDAAASAVLHEVHNVPRIVFELRAWLGSLSVFMALAFTSLFKLKDFDLGYAREVQQIYVLLEPSLISSFLVVFATYYTELMASLRLRADSLLRSTQQFERPAHPLRRGEVRQNGVSRQPNGQQQGPRPVEPSH